MVEQGWLYGKEKEGQPEFPTEDVKKANEEAEGRRKMNSNAVLPWFFLRQEKSFYFPFPTS